MGTVPDDHLTTILRLRLLIARAAQRDSLAWWEDESLVPEADLLLARLFPRTPRRAAHRLALQAARARHTAVLRDHPMACHLFALGDEEEFRLDDVLADGADLGVAATPIRTRSQLADELRALGPEPPPSLGPAVGRGGQLDLGGEVAELPLVDRALALAWAYTRAEAPGAAYPFYVPTAGRQA